MATPANFDPEKAENMEEIEQQFAVKAVEQMDAYYKLLEAIPGSKLHLTPHDDEIYEKLLEHFPEYKEKEKVQVLDEESMKTKDGKAKWRAYMKEFEDKIEDYNFGTLLRLDSSDEYSEKNTMFAVRMQFYAIEVARNRLGLNDWICKK